MNKPNTENEVIYFGPGLKNEEIDETLSKLYEKLLDYVRSIFELVEKFCPGYDDQARLALNIAETDGNLLQRLVAKECEKRRELMRTNEVVISQKSMNKPLTIHNINHFVDEQLLIIEKKDDRDITK
jgi:hypothetical protein